MTAKARGTLGVIGQGYVGLPLAMSAVKAGWNVIGFDVIKAKIDSLNLGKSPIEDISDSALADAINQGKYLATSDFSLISKADVITICVPTPLNETREPDISLLVSAVKAFSPHISKNSLVVNESTSYPGTLREVIIPLVNEWKKTEIETVYFASAPERVNPADPVWNQKNTPRLVGPIDEESRIRAFDFYSTICDQVVLVSTPEVAEAAKLLENSFRLINISFINEVAKIFSGSGINVHEVIDAASTKPYGFMPFRPGVGVGGHCIPVDPLYLTWWAKQNNFESTLVNTADLVNLSVPKHVGQRALELVKKDRQTTRALILGVAYKPGISDTRETPVLGLKDFLESVGVEVAWYDPVVKEWEDSLPVGLDWTCDVAILAINQPGINLDQLLSRGIPILDCTNSFAGLQGVIQL